MLLRVDPDVTTLLDYHHSPHAAGPATGSPGRAAARAAPRCRPAAGAERDRGQDAGRRGSGRPGRGRHHLCRRAGRPRGAGQRGARVGPAQGSRVRAARGAGGRRGRGARARPSRTWRSSASPSGKDRSLVAALSAARPKIADYPFTTLVPSLGVVEAGEVRYLVADVPGLIPGASEGKGLGLEFLRHVGRCSVLVHVVDAGTLGQSGPADRPGRHRGRAGGVRRTGRPALVALNKVDLPDAQDLADLVATFSEARGLVFPVSAAARTGLRELSFAMAELVARARAEAPASRPPGSCFGPGGRRPGVRGRARGRLGSWCGAASRPTGCARPTSPTTRRSATWPTGWPSSVSRTPCSRPVPRPATRWSSATVRAPWCSTGSRPCGPAPRLLHGRRGTDLRLEGR